MMYSMCDQGIKLWCIQGMIPVSRYQGMMYSRIDQGIKIWSYKWCIQNMIKVSRYDAFKVGSRYQCIKVWWNRGMIKETNHMNLRGGLLDILCSVHDADFFNESRLLILKFACKTRTRTKEKTVLVLNLLYSFRIRR